MTQSLTGVDEILVAVATKGDGAISQHFGHADDFKIYAVGPSGVRPVCKRICAGINAGRNEEQAAKSKAPSSALPPRQVGADRQH